MEPLTVTVAVVAGAVASALAGPKRRYKGEVGSLPGACAVPGDLGAHDWSRYRLRSRTPRYTAPYQPFRACPQGTQWDSAMNRCMHPRAQAAPGAAMPPKVPFVVPGMTLKGVRVMISRGPNMPAGDVVYDGKMSSEQMENLRRSIQQNATTAPDHRLISVVVSGPGEAVTIWPTQKITPTFAVNLRRLLAAIAA